MFPAKSLLSLALIAVSFGSSVVATPTPADTRSTLQFTRRLSLNGTSNIAENDRARAKVLKANGLSSLAQGHPIDRRTASFSVTNTAVTYTASVGVGSPATKYTLIIDTGSSNTWVGASKKYVKTKTSVNTGQKVSVNYGSGSFSGTEYTDTVTLSSALVITKQSIGVASTSTGFQHVDGILGIGPVDLTEGTLTSSPNTLIPTVTDNLLRQRTISTEVIGIFYAPAAGTSTGELTFGGTDSSKHTGSIKYTPLTTTFPASLYWGIDQSITYGSTTILSSTAGIVDTGTTLVLIATDGFDRYVSATGAKPDSATGLYKVTAAQYAKLSNLNFNIGSAVYPLTPNAQIFPRSLNTDIGGSSGSIYLIVADLGSDSGEGLDFIDGYAFLERYYSVFDTTKQRIGFAKTKYTTATSN